MSKKENKKQETGRKGGWDVLSEFASGVFSLINNNRIIPAFSLFTLAIVGVVAVRLPASDLGIVTKELVSLFASSVGWLIFMLVVTNIGWIFLTRSLQKMYKAEVDRLSKVRADLMHKNGDYSPILEHRSSEDASASIIVPAKTVSKEHESRSKK